MRIPRFLPLMFRLGCAVALVALLMYGVDWASLPQQFAAISWPPALIALFGLGAHFVVSPWKWQQALRIHNLNFALPYLIRANGTGFFLNNFLPSAIGGDAYRVLKTLPHDGHRARAISAVIIERLVGFAALVLLGGVGAVLLFEDAVIARTYLLVTLVGGGAVVSCLAAVHFGWMKPLTARVRHTKIFEAIAHNVAWLRRGRSRWVSLVAISLLFQVIAVANVYFLFQSLGVDASIAACALIGAVAGLATILPISINGIGVVEGSFAGSAVALGIPYEPALAVALLIRLFVLPPSIVFGLLYIWKGDAPTSTTRAASA